MERLLHAVAPSLDLDRLPHLDLLLSSTQAPASLPIESFENITISQAPVLHSTSTTHRPHSDLQPPTDPTKNKTASKLPHTIAAGWAQSGESELSSTYTNLFSSPNSYVGNNAVLGLPEAVLLQIPNLPVPLDSGTSYPVEELMQSQFQELDSVAQRYYPEPELEQKLLTLYFQNFHPLHSILHPPTFYHLHKSGFAKTDPSFRALCLNMCAIASRYSIDPQVRLDLEGNLNPSHRFAGFRYAFAGHAWFFLPCAGPTTLFGLQALLLLVIYTLGASDLRDSWNLSQEGLQRTQECGAHREIHPVWNADPVQDHVRRKVFFTLYNVHHKISLVMNKTPAMDEDDFDLLPSLPSGLLDVCDTSSMRTYVNPYQSLSRTAEEACLAFHAASLFFPPACECRSLLTVLNTIQFKIQSPNEVGPAKSWQKLVAQVSRDVNKWFDRLPWILKTSDIESCSQQLVCSVSIITWYQEFQIIINRTLLECTEEKLECGEDNFSFDRKICLDKSLKVSISLIQEANKLRIRNLLPLSFFWIPTRICQAVLVLISSFRTNSPYMIISQDEVRMRRQHILLAIEILKELAPSTYTAAVYSKGLKTLFDLLEGNNPPLLESLDMFFNQALKEAPVLDLDRFE